MSAHQDNQLDSEQQIALSVLRDLSHAPHAVDCFRIGAVVAAVVVIVVSITVFGHWISGVMASDELIRAASYVLLWHLVVSWVGLALGVRALLQPYGKKRLAVAGIALNGLVGVAPFFAVFFLF